MNICIIGYGMMGRWHSTALLQRDDCCLHTLVGRQPKATAAFAAEFGFKKWTTNINEALEDDEITAVIVASPSETHADIATACLMHNKHTLVEIPIAMSQADAERVVKIACERNLILGAVHPIRFFEEMIKLRKRLKDGQESVRHMVGQFYLYRLENIGSTGYHRSWTDNLLWHHTLHLLDFALWLIDKPVTQVQGFMPAPDPQTGTPMDVFYGMKTDTDQSLVLVGSYFSRQEAHEILIVTDLDTYKLDVVNSKLTSTKKVQTILTIQEANILVIDDFLGAVRDKRETFTSGTSVLPAMRVLQQVQNQWDSVHGAQSIPSRS